MTRVAELRSAEDWDGFRALARYLVHTGVAPSDVRWRVQGEAEELFDAVDAFRPEGLPAGPGLSLPREFVEFARLAALHADPRRHDRLYRWVLRLCADPASWQDTLSPERTELERMAQAVRREIHKMKAFVRFAPAREADGGERLVAWFEPAHYVVAAAAPFFVRRFATLRWSILTPRGCAHWDRERLALADGVRRSERTDDDDGQALWIAYYQSTFNPARVNPTLMRRQMPVRFWRHLPETQTVVPLAATAAARTAAMIESAPTARLRRRGQAGSAPPPAASADALQALGQRLQSCSACPLHAAATQAVPGEGPCDADIVLVGEQPGDQEDLEGRPFVGPAGQLLREALAGMPWASRTYVTNAVKHFKYELRGKRRIHKTPGQLEAAVCAGWLEQEIAAIAPRALVALGATAARVLLRRPVAVRAREGEWERRDDGLPVLIARHPAALLRLPPAERARAWPAWKAALGRAGEALAPSREASADDREAGEALEPSRAGSGDAGERVDPDSARVRS